MLRPGVDASFLYDEHEKNGKGHGEYGKPSKGRSACPTKQWHSREEHIQHGGYNDHDEGGWNGDERWGGNEQKDDRSAVIGDESKWNDSPAEWTASEDEWWVSNGKGGKRYQRSVNGDESRR